MSADVAYGVCVGDWAKLHANVTPRIGDRPLIALSGQTSIAVAYEAIRLAAHIMDVDALILQHDDLEITDPDGEAKILDAIASGAGLVGAAGGSSGAGIAWWNQAPIGHVRFGGGAVIDFGARSGDVECLEGSIIALSRQALGVVSFDPSYPGFHGYDADICRQATQAGQRIAVIDMEVWHHTKLGFKTEQSHADWLAADQIFRTKWEL